MNREASNPGRFLILVLTALLDSMAVSAQTTFADVTEQGGIGHHQFVVFEGMFGGGVCVLDFNNDGNEDLYITSGMADDRLYENNGDGTFRNIFEGSGLEITRRYVTQGVASADVNRDGWPDLFVTTITSKDSVKKIPRAENLLFLNNGNATFRDVTVEFGLDQLQSFSTGVSFGDVNHDGYPDAYVGNYFLEYEGTLSSINDATIVNANSTAKGYMLINDSGKSFSNEYEDYGLTHRGFGFGGVFTDFDNDADLDLYVNHDFGYKATPNILLSNQFPDDEFIAESDTIGMDLPINSMGIAVGDYDNNGLLDYYVTNIRFNRFMVNQGPGRPFVDKSKLLGMGFVSISWGANFADFDNDTDLDLFVSNGDLNPNDVPMADFYFENDSARFTDKAHLVGLNDYGVGRGSAVFDMDNDGDLDLVVINQKPVLDFPVVSTTKLYRNDSQGNNWIKIALRGVSADKQGFGSRVEVVVGDLRMIREIDGGSSHLSQNSPIVHFGLGKAEMIDSVIVRWTGGKKQVLVNQQANTLVTIAESETQKSNWPLLAGLFAAGALAIGLLNALRRKAAAAGRTNT